jgi:putative ABC transport system ATP-binding protein
MTEALIIEARDLEKTYQTGDVEVRALRGIDLSVRRGEFLAVVGPSGSGKSTLFHILGGLTHPTGGNVFIDGKDLFGLSDSDRTHLRRSKVGFVFQKYNLLPTLTAADNIAMARHLAGNGVGMKEADFEDVLRLLGLSERLHHKPRAMSGGEQQRVAIARAIVNRPAILLADEPTGNLDSENSQKVLRLLVELNQKTQQTILLITHDATVASHAHRILHMQDGRLIEEADIMTL